MVVPTSSKVLLYLSRIVHFDVIVRDKKLATRCTYAVGKGIAMNGSLVSGSWKPLLLKSAMRISINYLQPDMLFKNYAPCMRFCPSVAIFTPMAKLCDQKSSHQGLQTQSCVDAV